MSRLSRSRSLMHKKRRYAFELLEPRLNMALTVPALSSLPGANHTIYLDFDGHVTSGTNWASGATINSPAYDNDADPANFSTGELQVIQRTFDRVAEDFAPFQVNVTTVPPTVDDLRNTGGTDTKWGIRVVVTRDTALNCGCGGIAYINSFTWNSDTPVFVFNTSEIGVAEAASHEVGHALGLAHDGTATSAYYQGHALGADTAYWSTIMGVGYYVDVSQWDKGEYTGSNNATSTANYGRGPDDLAIITGFNGFGYKSDDHGDSSLTASALTIVGSNLSGAGVIMTRTDSDYFQFSTAGGALTLNVDPAAIGANLDIEATLYDSSGAIVASSNPLMSLAASISTNVPAGQYFLKVDGVGAGTPTAATPTGYTDYASLGQYSITGTVQAITGGDVLSLSTTDVAKAEGNTGATSFTYTVTRTGDTSGTSTINYSVTGSGAAAANATDFVGGVLPGGSLTFAPGVTSLPIIIDVQGDTTVENNETFTVALSNPSATTAIATGSAVSTITNDDVAAAPPTLRISATSATKAEGSGSGSTPFVFTITRSGNTSGTSSVRYSVAGGANPSASSNDLTNGFVRNVTVNFAAGVSSVDVTIQVRQDTRRESNENFVVTLSGAVGATIATSSATGVILNDDRTGAIQGETDDEELIAVADPLWSFMPASMLTAQQLSVPIVTWINGEAFVGDLAHDHGDHDHLDHDHFGHDDLDHDHFASALSDDAGLDEDTLEQLSLSSLTTSGGTSGSQLWSGYASRGSLDVSSRIEVSPRQLALSSANNLADRSGWQLTSRWSVKNKQVISSKVTDAVDVALEELETVGSEESPEI